MKSLKKIDVLFIYYLIVTTLIQFLNWNHSPQFWILIQIRSVLVFGVFGLIYYNSKNHHPIINLLRKTYPIILSGYFYSETVYYNKLLFRNIDPSLARIESWIFGFQPSVAFSVDFSNRIYSEIMYFGYFSFYLLIVGFTLYVYFRKREFFNKTTFQLSASLYIFYLIFILVPSEGPQFYFPYPENALPDAYLFGHIMHFIQSIAEQPTGAFPSSHVGVSVIILILSKKIAPLFFKIAAPFVFILILSTVYIKAHYAVDILGGILFAPFILYLANGLYNSVKKSIPSKIYSFDSRSLK